MTLLQISPEEEAVPRRIRSHAASAPTVTQTKLAAS